MHLKDDDLVLHYYGELDAPAETAATAHLAGCQACRDSYTTLQRVLSEVEAAPEPVLPDGFERTVWARLEPQLAARRTGWMAWFQLTPARLALAAAVVVLVAGAFMAGRVSRDLAPALTAEQLRERILLVDLEEHLDRSQTMLVELVTSDGPDTIDMAVERERAEDLVAANRLYRQTAAATGDAGILELLDHLERVLVELAAAPDELTEADIEAMRSRIETEDLLFKVRVLSSGVRERQQQQWEQQQRRRAGQSSRGAGA
jgi:hypothetical protein